jgi:hypothetical protein
VIKALDRSKYAVVPIGITREGRWRLGREALKLLPQVLDQGTPVIPSVDPQGPKLVPLKAAEVAGPASG